MKTQSINGRTAIFIGKNARENALAWAEKGSRTAYFYEDDKVKSTNGKTVCEGWSDGTSLGGHWWSARLTIADKIKKMLAAME